VQQHRLLLPSRAILRNLARRLRQAFLRTRKLRSWTCARLGKLPAGWLFKFLQLHVLQCVPSEPKPGVPDPGDHGLQECDGVNNDCCSASFQDQCSHDPWQCKACTKHSDCPRQGAACHVDDTSRCDSFHEPDFCTAGGQCKSCSNTTAVNTNFDKNCCSKDFISTCPRDPHDCGPHEIAGSFEWKLTWAAAAGCKDVGSVAYVGGTDSTQGVRTMLQVCPAALLHGSPPLIDSSAGQLTEPRRAGECHIPQTPYLGGENGGSCRTAE
jgi:hypothetical protein